MKALRIYFFHLIACGLCICATAQQKRPAAGKEPAWATINSYDYTDTRLDHEAEEGYFDVEYEQQVSLIDHSTFYRRAIKILSEAGIQNSSEISVNFDPAYEQLTFHSIKIIRGNKTINELNLSRIKTIQQEKELDRFLYNGTLTSVLFLEDVQKGDVIEYSYTLKGFNPIFQGKYSAILDLNFGVPVGSLYYKLVVPQDQKIMYRNSNSSIEPTTKPNDNGTTIEWKLSQVKALHPEDDLPSWYDPYSTVFVSQYKSWKEVNDWAMNLFAPIAAVSTPLQKKIGDIAKNFSTKEDQLLAALRFVQDDIRYMGIEMGENSHKPGNPNKTFSQRFGDCKDKSYLLCTILNHLGIDAAPVLINTSEKKSLLKMLPSAHAFDHVTVQVRMDNKTYWLDPTISFQRGGLESITYPDYQCGLVIREGTDSLTMIDRRQKGITLVNEVFDIPDMSGKATMTVTTQYTGSYADDVRSSFNNNSRYEMKKTYRDYYAAYFEKISIDSIDYIDDDKSGKVITKEFYTIDDIWEYQKGAKKATFQSYVINGAIRKPKDRRRQMPLDLVWPARYQEEIEINLPEDWSADHNSETVSNSSCAMSVNVSNDGRRTINLVYKYENLKDYVDPDDMNEYLDDLDKQDKDFGYILTYNENITSQKLTSPSARYETSPGRPILMLVVVLLLIGGITWWARRR